MPATTTSLGTALTALRGIVMIVAGLFALYSPSQALRFAVLVGGGILLLDGLLNLAGLGRGTGRDMRFWTSLLRSISAIVAGLLIAFSHWLLPMMSIELLRWLIGVQAIVVGVIEALTPLLAGRASAPRPGGAPTPWGYVGSGIAYALFGLAVILVPLSAAGTLARIVAVLMILYALSLFVRVWRQRGPAIA